MPPADSSATEPFPFFLSDGVQKGQGLPSRLLVTQIHILLGGGVTWDRIHPDLRATFALGYYVGNVRNGGHSQFMSNARNFYDAGPERMLNWAMEAAERYGMPETISTIRGVLAWMTENPDEPVKQTGANPNVSPALEPFDAALFDADKVDEETWLARVETLPEAIKSCYLSECGYSSGYVRFPAIISDVEELLFLATFEPVKIVASSKFDATIEAVVGNDKIAKSTRLAAHLSDLKADLPQQGTCAALRFLAEGAHLQPEDVLRVGAATPPRSKRNAILTTPDRQNAFFIEHKRASVLVYDAEGNPDASGEIRVPYPSGPGNLLSRLFNYKDPKRRFERDLKRLSHKNAVRKTRKLGKVPIRVGEEIVALNDRVHVAEALALWFEETNCKSGLNAWWLEGVDADAVRWRFGIGNIRLSVFASMTVAQIKSEEATYVYQYDDLCALRKSLGPLPQSRKTRATAAGVIAVK